MSTRRHCGLYRFTWIRLLLIVGGIALAVRADASFHLMQIEQVIGGVNGDTTAQAIQLRMRSVGQTQVSGARLRAFDATGANPVVIINLASNVAGGIGKRILIASAAFLDKTSPTAVPDFTMTNLIPESYLAAGRLTFESDAGTIYWSLSWGGANYTGSTTGDSTNDSNGDFGPPFASPLPSTSGQAVSFGGIATAGSTANSSDYSLTPSAATFINNSGTSFTINVPPPYTGPWYVNVAATPSVEDGMSWETAFTTLQEPIDAAFAAGGGEVWVAKGDYSEPRSSMMHIPQVDTGSLVLKEGVDVYGGFAGNETELNQRNVDQNVTTIDGRTALEGGKALHVVVGADNATLDGFVILGGGNLAANAAGVVGGAGMYNGGVSPTIANCTFSGNIALLAAGMHNFLGANPTISNCVFTGNVATGGTGGAIMNTNSSPIITDCTFTLNVAGFGGAMYNITGSTPVIERCLFTANGAAQGGALFNTGSADPTFINCLLHSNAVLSTEAISANGASIYNSSSAVPTFVNCTIAQHPVADGLATVFNDSASPTFLNCILWNGLAAKAASEIGDVNGAVTTATFSDIRGGVFPGEGNISEDPLFADGVANFHLTADSPCIDAANSTGAPLEDIENNPRPEVDGTKVDMGAYEFNGAPTRSADIDGSGQIDAVDVQLVINAALGLSIGNIDPNAPDVDRNLVIDAVDVQLTINGALGIV